MRMPFLLTAIVAASALVFTGCATKSARGGLGADDPSLAGNGGAGVGIDPNDPFANDPTNDAYGAYGSGNFEDTRTRVTDAGLQALLFTFDSYTLPVDELAKADAAAQYLLSNPSHVMVIEGHCDERGSNEYNLSLSEQRAIGVRDYMVSLGIDAARLQTRPFGEEKPADPSHTEEAYRQNRRAEFVPYK